MELCDEDMKNGYKGNGVLAEGNH